MCIVAYEESLLACQDPREGRRQRRIIASCFCIRLRDKDSFREYIFLFFCYAAKDSSASLELFVLGRDSANDVLSSHGEFPTILPSVPQSPSVALPASPSANASDLVVSHLAILSGGKSTHFWSLCSVSKSSTIIKSFWLGYVWSAADPTTQSFSCHAHSLTCMPGWV